MRRILTIQDVSCVGKCSLTVALPIISAMQVECAILPTAVLSTHTMFPNPVIHDLTDEIVPMAQHWKSQRLDFDMIYTGYMASGNQIDEVIKLMEMLGENHPKIVVDPAMADHGKLYKGFDDAFVTQMKKLCCKADYLLPNLTEAALLTDTPYKDTYTNDEVKSLLKKLCGLGVPCAIITGVAFEEGCNGFMGYDKIHDEIFLYQHPAISMSYHGTGDIFASVFTGALAQGKGWREGATLAAEFVLKCIRITQEETTEQLYGVHFEKVLGYLINQ